MITKISGVLLGVHDEQAIVAVDPFEYEVLVPGFARQKLQSQLNERVSLYTLHYLDGNPNQGKLVPRLIGFSEEIEREFFEMFCSVDGIGMRKALRAMTRPVKDVAAMIADQDAKGLATLPGVGAATAERMIAKLRRKMSRFALIAAQSSTEGVQAEVEPSLVDDIFAILIGLGHSEAEARRLIDAALAKKKRYSDVDAMLQEIYEQSK